MKVLSLWQPWAGLIAIGAKGVETRGWETKYRGKLWIHSAKKWTPSLSALLSVEPFRSVVSKYLKDSDSGPLFDGGNILCQVDLVDCRPTESFNEISAQERAFGNYAPGRFGWVLKNVKPLSTPIPLRGFQQIFNWNPDCEGLEKLQKLGFAVD